MKTTLIIPAYNESKRLKPFLESIAKFHARHRQDIGEVILVDDGSQDNTINIAHKYQQSQPLKIIRHSKNQGKGAAIKTGVINARGDLIVFMDADGATDISEFPKMIEALQNHDIAIGNRWMPGAKTDRHSLLRRLSGWIYRHYMKLFDLGDIDTMCGFKGYKAEIAKKLFSNLIEERWLFDTEIAYKAIQSKYKIKNFPIKWESKDGSKLDTKALLKSALQIWPLIRKIRKQK